MIVPRRTLAGETVLAGRGLHTGVPVTATFRPAEDGIHFRVGTFRTEAIPENVTDTTRATRLGEAGTIEHVMAALAGLGITDADVELTAPECPGLGGSALDFVLAFEAVGTVELPSVERADLFARVYHKEDGGAEIAIGKGDGRWSYAYETGERWPGRMVHESADIMAEFRQGLAPARTFYLYEEIPMIEKIGLGQGLKAEDALMLGPDGFKGEARFPDEPARHKLLDLLGDLALAGVPPSEISVSASRSGHRSNIAAAAKLRTHARR